jgi:hypothetical protein
MTWSQMRKPLFADQLQVDSETLGRALLYAVSFISPVVFHFPRNAPSFAMGRSVAGS